MFHYKLRTLLILLAIMPPLLWLGWGGYQAWKAEQDRRAALKQVYTPMPGGILAIEVSVAGDGYARSNADGQVILGIDPAPPAVR